MKGPFLLFAATALVVLAVTGTLLGCRAANPRADLQHAVEALDSAHEPALLDLLARRDLAFDRYREEKVRLETRFRALNSDYGTPSAELEAVIAEFEHAWVILRDETIEVALEMRSLMTEEEWRELAPLDFESLLAEKGNPSSR